MVEVLLGLVDERADLLEPLQVPDGTTEEEAEYHIHGIDETQPALLLVRHEVYHHVRLEVADRNEHVALHNDTERDGGVWRPALRLLNVRDTQDDEHPAVIYVVTGTFVRIGNITNIVVGDFERLLQEVNIFLRRAGHLHPAARLPIFNGTQTILSVPVCSHRLGSSSLFGDGYMHIKLLLPNGACMTRCRDSGALRIVIIRVIVVHCVYE